MKKKVNVIIHLFARYLLILLLGIGNLYIFYRFLTPLTIKSVAFLLSLYTKPLIINNFIYFNRVIIEIIPACVAGSAFYLLFVLLFSTPNISPKKRFYALITSFFTLFILNVLRIVFLVSINESSYFETVHWIFWNFISIIFIVVIWFSIVKIYNIKEIPMYSDIIYIKELIKQRKKSKRGKKH